MKIEINPQDSCRAEAFRMWMASPMSMVTLVKTLDVCRLVKASKRNGMKFTMMMCWCIGKTASQVEEFFTLPIDGKLYRYDKLAVNVIVENSEGGISFHTCAECEMEVKDCQLQNNMIGKFFAFVFRSDRPACIRYIRENGEQAFAEEMTKRGELTMKK